MIAHGLFPLAAVVIASISCSGSVDTPTTQLPPATTPAASAGHSMVFADDLEMVLLVNAWASAAAASLPPRPPLASGVGAALSGA